MFIDFKKEGKEKEKGERWKERNIDLLPPAYVLTWTWIKCKT